MNSRQKDNFIKETRSLINQKLTNHHFIFNDLTIELHSEVFNPSVFFSSSWFAEKMVELSKNAKSFIEVGCGTGIISLSVARENQPIKVYATDLIEEAAKITQKNTNSNFLEKQIQVFNGDVFDAIPDEIKADVIFWSLPFGFLKQGSVLSEKDRQVFDPGYRAINKFISHLSSRLNKNGLAYIGFSNTLGDRELLNTLLSKHGYDIKVVFLHKAKEKSLVDMGVYQIIEA